MSYNTKDFCETFTYLSSIMSSQNARRAHLLSTHPYASLSAFRPFYHAWPSRSTIEAHLWSLAFLVPKLYVTNFSVLWSHPLVHKLTEVPLFSFPFPSVNFSVSISIYISV